MNWLKKLTKTDKKHLRETCVPLEGLYSKSLTLERATVSANNGCRQCQEILRKL